MIRWNEAQCEKLLTLWRAQISTGLIAQEFGTTRQAICGKINRMGLSGLRPHAGIQRKTPATPTIRRAKEKLKVKLPPEPITDDKIPLSSRKTFMELTAFTCRWPVGDPETEDFFFCGMGVGEGCVYCPPHFWRSRA